MDSQATDLALQMPQLPDLTPQDITLTDAVKEAWKSRCSSLGEEEKKRFEALACNSLADYLGKLEAACKRHKEDSYGLKVIDWFGPIFRAVELFTPAAAVAIQAYPNPGSLVLGGIVGILQITSRLISYQKLTMQMLTKMGMKARILLDYEKDVYKDDYPVQKALIEVYGDIIVFCQKAFRFLTENGQLRAKIRGLKLILFRDYESQLGEEVKYFEQHMEELEAKACLCDKRRLKDLHDNQEAHHKEFGRAVAEARDHFDRHDELILNIWKREQNLREQKERREREEEKKRLLDWLSPLSFRGSYDQRCDEHLEGTGSWFLNSDIYKKWKASKESDLLWVKGKPGIGKSVLAAVTIADLKLEVGPKVALAYAFCRREDESSQNPITIFGALAKQICQQQLDINTVLESEYSASQRGEVPSQRILRMVMNSALSHFTTTFLVIDALDECKNNVQLANDLLDLMQDKGVSPVQIIVFSRHDYYLEERFKLYKQMQPDHGANEEDLRAYIDSLFPDDSQASVNRDIKEECISKADGMFLWVKLMWQNLQKPMHSRQKLRSIRDIPPGLESIYDRILKDIYDQGEDVRSTAFLVLMWVTNARRPLDSSEMVEAVDDYSEAKKLKEAFKDMKPEDLVAICANLVFVDKDGYFRLCHESVRAHLDKAAPETSEALAEYQQQKQNAHGRLAEICLTYMLLEDFECGPAKSLTKLRSLVKKSPFLMYAAEFWGSHVSQDIAPPLQELIWKFVHSPARRELSMQIALYDPTNDSDLWVFTGSSNPLHILSIFGLRQTAETLPNVKTLSREADGSGSIPINYVLIGRHHEMCLWLIESMRTTQGLHIDAPQKISIIHLSASLGWADVLKEFISEDNTYVDSKTSHDGLTPLVRACKTGERETAATLIDNKANVNLKDGSGDSPLIVSTYSRHTSLVELLLKNGAEPNCRDANGVTPLHYAAETGITAIATALLERGADPLATAPLADDQTPLHIAAETQSIEVIRELHRVHTKLDIKTKLGNTALHIAAWHNSFKSAKILLKLGSPKDEVNNDNETALFIAAQEGALDTVRVLVEARCDVTLATSSGETAIHAAASSGKLSVVHCILRSQPVENWSALVNKPCEDDETPIHAAIEGGNAEIVKFLLKAGADGTVNGLLNSSPLHYAAHYGYSVISRLLLNHTKEANPRNEDEDTPLHFAARACKFEFIMQFFQDCAQLGLTIEINAQNESKKTALMVALDKGYHEVAQFLIEKGFVSIPDVDGNYPVHNVAWHGLDIILPVLLTHDGVTSQGYFGYTPFFCAAARGHLTTLKLLTPLSGEILNVRDDTQATPLLAALKNRQLEVANYLLDIKVDCDATDEFGNSPLHIAAGIGDLFIVQRLLNLGCKGDAANRYGETPFLRTVTCNSIEVVDALISAGFNTMGIPDSTGNSCSIIAANQGNLEMLQKLDELGARHETPNLLGRTAAFVAAENGHLEILEFLKDRGVNLDVPDLEGITTIIAAASERYLNTVNYLLQCQAHAVNQFSTWDKESPLSVAATCVSPSIIQRLLAAGADPYHRDASGLNALEIAVRHRPSLREMHKALHFYNPDSLDLQKQILCDTIRLCCVRVLLLSKEPSVAEFYHRISRVSTLSHALVRMQDYDAAKICFMELFWTSKFILLEVTLQCDICGSKKFVGDKFVCKSCYRSTTLCEQCHKEYQKAGQGAPDVLEEIMNLEKQVQPVRAVTPQGMSLFNVSQIMNYFEGGSRWMSARLDKYEAWEQKYNSSSRYRQLQRPGQEFLKMVKTMRGLVTKLCRADDVNPENIKSLSKLSDEYKVYQRKHRADKEIRDFVCKDHEYFLISVDEQEKVKTAGVDLDTDSGRLTASFLQTLLKKYSHGSDTLATGASYRRNEWSKRFLQSGTFGSQANFFDRGATERVDRQEPRPQRPKRSSTISAWKPVRRFSKGSLMIAPIGSSNLAPGPKPFPGRRTQTYPRRAQTLPITAIEAKSLQIQSFGIEMKDTQYFAAINARIDSKCEDNALNLPMSNTQQLTVKKTVSVSFTTEPDILGESPLPLVPSAEQNELSLGSSPISPDEPMLTLTLSSEPESMVESQAEESVITLTESHEITATAVPTGTADAKGTDRDAIEVVKRDVRLAYMMIHDECEDNDAMVWLMALKVTDAMVPGFVKTYFRIKKEERDETKNEQQEERENKDEKIGTRSDYNDDSDNDDDYKDTDDARKDDD